MFETVSVSETGQMLPPPTREERDAAYSSGAGRKAVEVPVPEDQLPEFARRPEEEAPVGLELETRAQQYD